MRTVIHASEAGGLHKGSTWHVPLWHVKPELHVLPEQQARPLPPQLVGAVVVVVSGYVLLHRLSALHVSPAAQLYTTPLRTSELSLHHPGGAQPLSALSYSLQMLP